MKSTIQIISELEQMERVQWGHYSAPKLCTKDARDRLNDLQQALSETVKQRDEAFALNQELYQARSNARAEPSRLEIAAMIMQGFASRKQYVQLTDSNYALSVADYLIAAAKEAK